MKRRSLLKALPVLWLPSAIRAQEKPQGLGERIKRDAEDAEHSKVPLPIFPRQERAVVDAPFSASFLAKVSSNGREYPIRSWRRSDGSTRDENVVASSPLPIKVEVTVIADYGRSKLFAFVTVGGVLKADSIAENPILPESRRTSGESLIKIAWKTLESENAVLLEGVDARPCERLLLESPYGSKTLEVWISEDLQIILKEELRRNSQVQHLYLATSIDRSEPDPSLFEPPISGRRP